MLTTFPSVTWPSHTSLITGAFPSRHGVIGNAVWNRETKKQVKHIGDPELTKDHAIRVPTLYNVAHQAGLSTASVIWPCSNGAKTLDWIIPDSNKPGTYSEILRVEDEEGRLAWDFTVVQVVDPMRPDKSPPIINAAYYPTTNINPGDEVTFKVRTFQTSDGQEVWDFADGTKPVRVRSDGDISTDAKKHNQDGYAVTTHRFTKPRDYIVRVERTNKRGEKATAHLLVQVADTQSN